MSRLRLSDLMLRWTRFSLRGFLLVLALASLGFAGWWTRPVLINRLPPELCRKPTPEMSCWVGFHPEELWVEHRAPSGGEDLLERLELTTSVRAAVGKCWARRQGLNGWVLDGVTEIFTQKGERIIRAEYASGVLHGEFGTWYTTGQVRERGRYAKGEKDGVWEVFERDTHRVESHKEYECGRKVGIWTSPYGRSHYRDGKLFLDEITIDRRQGICRVGEYDANGDLERVTLWSKDRAERLGVDHFAGNKRHGSWFRRVDSGERQVEHRGQWTNGLPSGEWVYEREEGPVQRLEFRHGALVAIDGELIPVLLPNLANDFLREGLVERPQDYLSSNEPRQRFIGTVLGLVGWEAPKVDPRLAMSQEEFDALWSAPLPDDFEYTNLPTNAALVLGLRGAGLTLDYRFGAIWITTPELAATWRDETESATWVEAMNKAEERRLAAALATPYLSREIHDWKSIWLHRRGCDFPEPLQTAGGIASRIDGSQAPAVPRLRLPVDLVNAIGDTDRHLTMIQFFASECEALNCRFVLRGDTLFLEPRN